MADEELPNEALDDFESILKRFPSTVWINPIPERFHDSWDRSGTIALLKSYFPMFDLTLNGIEAAVERLMQD